MKPLLYAFAVSLLASCERAEAPSTVLPIASIHAPAPPPLPATLRGKVILRGKAPPPRVHEVTKDTPCGSLVARDGKLAVQQMAVDENGRLKEAFVSISKGLEAKEFIVPDEPVTIGFECSPIVPRVFLIRVSQDLRVEGFDRGGNVHNVHFLERNQGRSLNGSWVRPLRRFRAPEIGMKVQCEIHPWEAAYVHVMAHPFFAVTGGDGEFRIEGIPPGRYTLSAWHDVLGQRDVEVQLDPGETWVIDFDYEGS